MSPLKFTLVKTGAGGKHSVQGFLQEIWMTFIFSVLGALLVVEGIPYFAFPGRVKNWALALQEVPEKNLRIMGSFSILAGLLLLYIVKVYFR